MDKTTYWILRCEHRLLFLTDGAQFPVGHAADFGNPERALIVSESADCRHVAVDVAEFPKMPGAEAVSVRAIFTLAGPEVFALAGRATQLLDWQANHRYCGRCGTPTVIKPDEPAMHCPACGLLAYPRLSPAVMVLVRDGEKLLLARSPHFKPGVYSALAGFVEPGETLEECAVREVREEVGIEIANLRYFASQPWPFPNSLMIAFFADYAGGTITPEPGEIEDAGWFLPDALPLLPDPVSISRRLIDAALAD
ncbi:NADH pyrophosphatase [Azonexus hydrophilus]|uniref:NAD(+) diphosphatase n=1 Tax=Azonexus hydrophilus TaxID=418702 RepID=A0A1R1I1Y3_9RHOO|nr:NAD(+) diphosphatase [Azonexus hydrophilus]OMG52620.1 NADH pyrophosphatase [Azonexus hydrophilus]